MIEELRESLKVQIGHYQGMLSLCEEEKKAIEGKDVETLLSVLEKKQEHIQGISRAREKTEKEMPEILKRKELKALLVELGKTLMHVLEKEKENEKKLLEVLEEMRKDLQALGNEKKIQKAYRFKEEEPKFLDKRR